METPKGLEIGQFAHLKSTPTISDKNRCRHDARNTAARSLMAADGGLGSDSRARRR